MSISSSILPDTSALNGVPTRLPDDLEPIQFPCMGPGMGNEPVVSIRVTGMSINRPAYKLLGEPERITLSFGPRSRMLSIQSGDPANSRKASVTKSGGIQLQIPPTKLGLNLPGVVKGKHLRLAAHLVEGRLLVGPLPVAGATP